MITSEPEPTPEEYDQAWQHAMQDMEDLFYFWPACDSDQAMQEVIAVGFVEAGAHGYAMTVKGHEYVTRKRREDPNYEADRDDFDRRHPRPTRAELARWARS